MTIENKSESSVQPSTDISNLPMQRYTSHKVVGAAQVTEVQKLDNGYAIGFKDPDGNPQLALVPEAWVDNKTESPESLVGGFFVRYRDGYTSWSPAKEFEEGYIPHQSLIPYQDDAGGAIVVSDTRGPYEGHLPVGLQLERFDANGKQVAVADYVRDDDSQLGRETPDRGSLSFLELMELAEEAAPAELKPSIKYMLALLGKK